MSILESVYKAFTHLDRDYARSKKSRTEFIKDKFGGDINIGSIIILDAIREEGVSENPEDIQKLSFIKDSFAFFQENASRLDKLETFSTASADLLNELAGILDRADSHGTKQVAVPQAVLWENQLPALHYVSTKEGMAYTPLGACKVFCVFNENMAGLLQQNFNMGGQQLNVGDKFRIGPNGALRQIQDAAIARSVR